MARIGDSVFMHGETTHVEAGKYLCAHCDEPISSDWYIVDRSKLNLPTILLHAECVEAKCGASFPERVPNGPPILEFVPFGEGTYVKGDYEMRTYELKR